MSKEKQKIILLESSFTGIKGARPMRQVVTPEYKKNIEEANEKIRLNLIRKDITWNNADRY